MRESIPMMLILISLTHLLVNAIWLRLSAKYTTLDYILTINNVLTEPFLWIVIAVTIFNIGGVIFGFVALMNRDKKLKDQE